MRLPPLHVILWATLITTAGCRRDDADGAIEGTGTLEVVESDVSPTVAARVLSIRADEGQAVRSGDIVAELTVPSISAQIEQQHARARSASARLRELQRGSRSADIARARAELEAAETDALRTARDLDRARALARDNVISAQDLDRAQSAARAAAARREGARAAYQRVAEGARREDIEAASAEVEGASAGERIVRATAGDLLLRAPFDGVVTSRNAEPGEVLAPGQSVVTIGKVSKPWVRVYLNQAAVARIRIGQVALGYLDAFPGQSFRGRVVSINTAAEFTPRVALTEQERADMLFGVKVEFADGRGMLKPGIPITVRIPATPPAR